MKKLKEELLNLQVGDKVIIDHGYVYQEPTIITITKVTDKVIYSLSTNKNNLRLKKEDIRNANNPCDIKFLEKGGYSHRVIRLGSEFSSDENEIISSNRYYF